MMNIFNRYIFFAFFAILLSSCSKEILPPQVVSYKPVFGPPKTLLTVKGINFTDLVAINFNDNVAADFNPSYGTDSVLLFRVPKNAPLGENQILIKTLTGEFKFPFRVTLEPPEVKDFFPKSANEKEVVTIYGKNFFDPLTVLFVDSVAGNIVFKSPDSIKVEVPTGVKKGRIKVKANGGSSVTGELFFSTKEILVSDFDGNGVRADAKKWLYYGVDQNANTAIQSTTPTPTSKNFLKLSGKDPGTTWIGGTETNVNDPAVFTTFDIKSKIDDTFIEFDINNNGAVQTYVIVVMTEKGGSPNDFSYTLKVDGIGWKKEKLILSRFKDVGGLFINPQKIKNVKFHLYNTAKTTKKLEVNIDNLKFIQIN